MNHEETRERLDCRKIAAHYAEQLRNPYYILVFVLFYLLSFLLWAIYDSLDTPSHAFTLIMYAILAVGVIFTAFLAYLGWEYLQLRRGNFRVVIAPLIKTNEVDYDPISGRYYSHLSFGKQGIFFLSSMPLYQSSPYYKTTKKELMDRSCNGDCFYLIKRNKRYILMIYPTRCFLWDGEIHKQ